MKLTIFSDPHVDIHEKRGYSKFIDVLVNHVLEIETDILLITGDVAGHTKFLEKFFAKFEEYTTEIKYKLFVPGNHDIWVHAESLDGSWIKYYQLLPELCSAYGWHYLPGNPLKIGDTAFVGSIGWYDYSTRNQIWDDRISQLDYSGKINPQTSYRWMDGVYAKFGQYSDKEITDHFCAELVQDIQKLGLTIANAKAFLKGYIPQLEKLKVHKQLNSSTDTKLSKLVVATHFVPFKKYVHYTGNLDWDYFSSFIGSTKLGELIQSIDPMLERIAVFGHTHLPKSGKIADKLVAHCVPIGYPREWRHQGETLNAMFKERIRQLVL